MLGPKWLLHAHIIHYPYVHLTIIFFKYFFYSFIHSFVHSCLCVLTLPFIETYWCLRAHKSVNTSLIKFIHLQLFFLYIYLQFSFIHSQNLYNDICWMKKKALQPSYNIYIYIFWERSNVLSNVTIYGKLNSSFVGVSFLCFR